MYSVRLPLQVNANMRPVIEKRFRILTHISNQTRKRAKHLLSKLKHDELYQQMLQEYIRLKKIKLRRQENRSRHTPAEESFK